MSEARRFSERLIESMKDAGYEPRPSVIEREFNLRYWGHSISFQAVRRWLRGEAMPTQDRLQVLAEWLTVDPHWLRFGEKIKRGCYCEPPSVTTRKVSPEEDEAFKKFLSLSSDKRHLIMDLIKSYK